MGPTDGWTGAGSPDTMRVCTVPRPPKEPAMPFSHLPAVLFAWFCQLVGGLDRRSAPRLLRLLAGALFARGRRTVTSWFRAAGITTDFRRAYCALWAAGRRAENLAFRLLRGPLAPLLALAPATTCC